MQIATRNSIPHPYSSACLALSLLFFYTLAIASAEFAETFNLTEIASGIFVHQGKHVSFESPGHDDIANIGFIVGDKCVAVIDTGGSVNVGRALLSAIEDVTSLPICFVINTHIHFDHLLGNIVFKKNGVQFVGHLNLADEVAANRTFFLDQYSADLGDDPTQDSIVAPNLLVDGDMKIDLGNRTLTLTAHRSAHSHTDLTIYDPQTKTLWLSDLLFMQRVPSLDGSLKGWLSVLDQLKETSAERLVPGHGPSSVNPLSAMDAQRHYLDVLLLQTRQKIKEGLFMEEIVDSVGNGEQQKWLLFEQHHKRNITRAFSELEWE
ncbi:MAG: quinoprotein relay system zinc metallohydrolase 2 [Gammaproteobacteria bacterium]|jgi:quinoprotein relay system zinc metallohydrolase 2